VLETELARWRRLSFSALVERIGHSETLDIRGASGTPYQVEVQVFWDNAPGGVLRVLGSVDDGSLRAFVPLTQDFLLGPDGSLVGENEA